MMRRPTTATHTATLFPSTTLFRSPADHRAGDAVGRPAPLHQYRLGRTGTGQSAAGDGIAGRVRTARRPVPARLQARQDMSMPLSSPNGGNIAIVGPSETERVGVVPDLSMTQLPADRARLAVRASGQIGMTHVCTPVTKPHYGSQLLL